MVHFVLWSETLKNHLNKNPVNPATLNVCCVSPSISIQFHFFRRWRKVLLGNTFHLISRILLLFYSNYDHVNWISKAISDDFSDRYSRPILPHLNFQPQRFWVEEYKGICFWWRWAQEYFMRTIRYIQLIQNLRPF